MGFACWGQLGQPYSPTNEAASGAAAVKCDALFRCGSRLEKPSRLGEPKSPGVRLRCRSPKTSMSIDTSRADARKANIAHLCIPAATRRWKRRALVPYCSSACVNEP